MTLVIEPPTTTALRAEVRAFLADARTRGVFEPRCDSWLTGFSREFTRALGERGWIGLNWPSAYGGRDRPEIERHAITEELLAAGAPVAAHWLAQRQTGPLLLRVGSERQKRSLLPAIARGECAIAICMSEPSSGSDLASVRTRAKQVKGGWRLRGRKVWTSHAHKCDLAVVFCRTSDPTGDRHSGFSQLLMDLHAEGVSIRPIPLLSGEAHFSEVTLDDVFVPDEDVIGEVGNGWDQVTAELALERSGPERFMAVFPLLLAYVQSIAASNDGSALETIGVVSAHLLALRKLSLSIVDAVAAGRDAGTRAALVKDLGTRFEQALVETLRITSAREPDEAGDDLARQLAQAITVSPNFTLRGGTNEILRSIVARDLMSI